jgi:hypothetical protein
VAVDLDTAEPEPLDGLGDEVLDPAAVALGVYEAKPRRRPGSRATIRATARLATA